MKKDSQFTEMRLGVASQIDRVIAMASRATLAPMLLRSAVLAASIAGYAVAWPPATFTSGASIGLVLLAFMPALFPRGPWPSIVIAMIVGGYLASTGLFGVPAGGWRVLVAAAAIYLVHAGAAFAAVLPYDSVVTDGLFVPWLLRVAGVLVLTAAVATFVAVLPSVVGTHRMVIASVAGFVAALAVALYLLYLWRRREPGSGG